MIGRDSYRIKNHIEFQNEWAKAWDLINSKNPDRLEVDRQILKIFKTMADWVYTP